MGMCEAINPIVRLMCASALMVSSSVGFAGLAELRELRFDRGEITAIVEHDENERVDWARYPLAGLKVPGTCGRVRVVGFGGFVL